MKSQSFREMVFANASFHRPPVTGMLVLLISGLCLGQGSTSPLPIPAPPAPSLPPALNKFVDPTFNTTLMRLTDENDGAWCSNVYPFWPSVNMDSTRLFTQCVYLTAGNYWAINSIFLKLDPVTFTVTDKHVNNETITDLTYNPSFGWISLGDASWSNTSPSKFYAHTDKALLEIDVDTKEWTQVADFSDLTTDWYLWELFKSADDQVFTFSLKNRTTSFSEKFFVWYRKTRSVRLMVSTFGSGLPTLQKDSHIDKSGRYLIVAADTLSPYTFRVYDLNTRLGHTDLTFGEPDNAFGHGDYGTGIAVSEAEPAVIVSRSLATPHQYFPLWEFKYPDGNWEYTQDAHISMAASNEAWALVSRQGYATSPPPSDILTDEIFFLATDGSRRVFRMAHHHSVWHSYYDSPRADISRDGRFVTFTSNWGDRGRTDVFLLKVPLNAPNQSPAAK